MRRLWILSVLPILILGSLSPAFAAGPSLVVQAPADGAVIEGPNVKVTFTVNDFKIIPSSVPVSEAGKHPEVNRPGEGHVHLVLDLQPLVIWQQNAPYSFSNVPSGEHQLMVELVNNDHSSLSPPVMQRISFRSSGAIAQQLPTTGATLQAGMSLALLVLGILLVVAGWLVARRISSKQL
jgi:hypothetical protein